MRWPPATPSLAAPLFEATVWLGNLLGGGNDNRRFIEPTAALAEQVEGAAAQADSPALAGRLWLHLASSLRHHQPGRASDLYARAAGAVAPGRRPDRAVSCAGLAARSRTHAKASWPRPTPNWTSCVPAPTRTIPPRLAMFLPEAEGFVAAFEGRRAEARVRTTKRYIACATSGGVDGALSVALVNLADIALALGDVPEAIRLGRDLVARLRQGRNRHDLGWALGNLTGAHWWPPTNWPRPNTPGRKPWP